MKSMLAFATVFGAATLASAQSLSQPLPSVVHSALPANPHPTTMMMNQPTNWGGNYVDGQTCAAGDASCSASRRGACGRLWNWLTFRVCPPNHAARVPHPYHAPLRTYFPYTPAPIGANGPLDCDTSRNRFCHRGAAVCAPTCASGSTMIARPGYEGDAATAEPKPVLRRMISALDGSALLGLELGRPGSGLHYAGTKSPGVRPAPSSVMPAAALQPATAIRPFTNP